MYELFRIYNDNPVVSDRARWELVIRLSL
jgi:hypothetical protein